MKKTVALKPIRQDAEVVLHAYQQVSTLVVPGVSLEQMHDTIAALDNITSDITQKEKQLEILRIQRNSILRTTSDYCVRARMAAKSQFGSNSVEYNYFGGTPDYNRKVRSSRTPEFEPGKMSA